ncbi:EscR/YscR/HrcR family type III secretion system export apparatus protein [bacterium]|nr:EscR/YscR/HrcR family type III secretion system export apparatus protein [bacterium]
MSGETIFQQPIIMMMILACLSLMPFFILLTTAFVKLSAVFSILRSALGTPQIPPNSVITGLSLLLSIFIMFPVLQDIKQNFITEEITWEKVNKTEDLDKTFHIVLKCVKKPAIKFLTTHAHPEEIEMLNNMMMNGSRASFVDSNLMVLVTAFVLSELKEAFQIGFLLFLPFIVIDMVVANILQAMGMVMLSPTTISLPFKLLLFVLADGWYLLVEGLLSGYLV